MWDREAETKDMSFCFAKYLVIYHCFEIQVHKIRVWKSVSKKM